MRDWPRVFGLDQLAAELAWHITDQVDLDLRVLDQQACSGNRRACGRSLEILLPHFIEGVEVAEILQEHLGLDDVIERAPSGLEGAREILHDVMRAFLDIRSIERKVRVLLGFGGNTGLE